MIDFKFFEALKLNDPNNKYLKDHPFVQNATFGLEIEFIVAAAPYEDMKPEWLALALSETKFEEEYLQTYQHNDPDYEKNDNDFSNYIRINKKRAWESMWDIMQKMEFSAEKYDDQYKQIMISYWYKKIEPIIRSAGFRVGMGKESVSNLWAVGDDGNDSVYNLPVLEIRSGILNQQDIEKLSEVLEGISDLMKQYKQEIRVEGNTGLHIHVANNNTKQQDGFSRLAVAQTADEDAIWDINAKHDRDMRYAMFNKAEDYEQSERNGAHSQIIFMLLGILKDANTTTISNKILSSYVNVGLSRNSGINITTEHPTVEYRYLSSQLVAESPQKVIQFIQYFINHTASMSNKGRIKFEDNDVRIVLTKLPNNMVKIDRFNKKELEDEKDRQFIYKFPRIPRPTLPRKELDKPAMGRQDMGFTKWFKSLPEEEQKSILKKNK